MARPSKRHKNRTRTKPEILLPITRGNGTLRSQIEAALREGARSGRLGPHSVLPSSRLLARDLHVSRGVVVAAYEQLISEGFLISLAREKTVVAPRAQRVEPHVRHATTNVPRYDFKPGVPDVREFPRREWGHAAKQILRSASDHDLGYGDVMGAERLRNCLAGYLGRVRAVDTVSAHVLICAGVTQAVGLAVRALLASGIQEVALEDPSHPDLGRLVAAAGARVVYVRVDEHGLVVGSLLKTRARAVIVTPAHQFPTGSILSAQRRLELVQWASSCGGFIIEDDYDAEYRYDAPPVGAIQGLAPDRVVYTGSASKILAPGLRLGWMCLPPSLLDAASDAKKLADLGSPSLDQLTYAEFVASGGLDRHLRRMRLIYRRRRDALVRMLAARTSWQIGGVAAGLHLVATMTPRADERRIVAVARARDVGFHPMSFYYRHQPQRSQPALVFGYGQFTETEIEDGIQGAFEVHSREHSH